MRKEEVVYKERAVMNRRKMIPERVYYVKKFDEQFLLSVGFRKKKYRVDFSTYATKYIKKFPVHVWKNTPTLFGVISIDKEDGRVHVDVEMINHDIYTPFYQHCGKPWDEFMGKIEKRVMYELRNINAIEKKKVR